MGIQATVEGNLTKNPEGRTVIVNGQPVPIVEFRVFAEVRKLVGDQWQQDDAKSSAVDVTIWTEALGEQVLGHFRTGARVLVQGALHLNEYTDKDGGHHAGLRMSADVVGLVPYRVESITFQPRKVAAAAAG